MGYNPRVLLLKLALVPMFLLSVSLVAQRWGPHAAGRLAGMPVVAGPILALIAFEQGPDFGAQAAAGALAGVPGVVLFLVAYARAAVRIAWPGAVLLALAAWGLVSGLMLQFTAGVGTAAALSVLALLVAPGLTPKVHAPQADRPHAVGDLLLRMAAGAALTVAVTWAAAGLGGPLSGLLGASPVLSTVVSVTTHRRQGGPYIAALLRAMLSGLYALAAFCAALALALPHWPIAVSVMAALGATVAMQAFTGAVLARGAASRGPTR